MPAQSCLFLCLKDNFGVLVHDPETQATAAIDAPEAGPVEAALKRTGWRLTDILVTHHHHDHTGGIEALKDRYRCRVVAPDAEAGGIPGATRHRPPGWGRMQLRGHGPAAPGASRLGGSAGILRRRRD